MIVALRLLTALVMFIAATILIVLVRSKDGTLRKILIVYFFDEFLEWGVVFSASIIWVFPAILTEIVLILLIPKAIVKIWFYMYISKQRSGDKLDGTSK
jgi:hypothetical protein